MTMVLDEVVGRETRHILQTYRRQPVTFVRGQGVRLWDAEGREYLDLLSGIGVASLGHANPGLARAIAEQAQTLRFGIVGTAADGVGNFGNNGRGGILTQ